jgi:protein involved in polysaccharide export with SLBB domain
MRVRQPIVSPRLRRSFALGGLVPLVAMAAWGQAAQPADGGVGSGGPVRLRQSMAAEGGTSRGDVARQAERGIEAPTVMAPSSAGKPSDFEVYVRRQPGGADIQRFGQNLLPGLQPGADADAAEYNPLVPPDYLLRAGDELVLTLWGSVDADLRLQVDRSGRITIPRVGPVMVSGVRYADLSDVISRRVGLVFKNFQLSVALGQLRGIRVYVTGFVQRPGAFTVNSLSTLAQALTKAGGPSAAGSYRSIQLRRGNGVVSQFDLYDLLLKGDRAGDVRLDADDVVHVGAVGSQVALIGSVNRPAIFEMKPGESIEALLQMAGGFSAVADRQRLALERLDASTGNRRTQLELPAANRIPLSNGDVLRAFNAADVVHPTGPQYKRVRIDGEVARPGEYVLPPASSMADALRAAGGISTNAYLYAAEFTRDSVRLTQQQNYERALRDFETQVTSASTTRRTGSAEEAAAAATSTAANSRLLEQLRALKPNGRIVLQMNPGSDSLPDLALENGDRLYVPARPTTVGVFGSVFSTGSYLHAPRKTVGDYLRLAGGPTRGADDNSVFVIRGNGSVNSSLQESSFFSRGNQIANLPVEPGDTIFVPEDLNKVTWIQNAKDWTQILYQLGIGLAGMKSAIN